MRIDNLLFSRRIQASYRTIEAIDNVGASRNDQWEFRVAGLAAGADDGAHSASLALGLKILERVCFEGVVWLLVGWWKKGT